MEGARWVLPPDVLVLLVDAALLSRADVLDQLWYGHGLGAWHVHRVPVHGRGQGQQDDLVEGVWVAIHLGQELEIPRLQVNLDVPAQVLWKALPGQVLGDLTRLQYLNLRGNKHVSTRARDTVTQPVMTRGASEDTEGRRPTRLREA